jgi:hypothetical protein
MARIPLPEPTDPTLEPKAAAIMGAVWEQFGVDYNVIRALANHADYTAAVANSCH